MAIRKSKKAKKKSEIVDDFPKVDVEPEVGTIVPEPVTVVETPVAKAPVAKPKPVADKPTADELATCLRKLADFSVNDPQNYRRGVMGEQARAEAYDLLGKMSE